MLWGSYLRNPALPQGHKTILQYFLLKALKFCLFTSKALSCSLYIVWGRKLILFYFSILIINCSGTIYWIVHPFPSDLWCHFYNIANSHIHGSISELSIPFHWSYLSLCVSKSYHLSYYSFIKSFLHVVKQMPPPSSSRLTKLFLPLVSHILRLAL